MLRKMSGDAMRICRPLLIAAAMVLFAVALGGPASVSAQEGQLAVDCDGTGGQVVAACQYGEQQQFTVAIHAVSVPAAGYPAYQAKLSWDPTVLDYRPSDEPGQEAAWPDCSVSARRDNRPGDASVLVGCVANPPLPSSYTGALVQLDFVCIGPGTSQLTLISRENDPSQLGSHFVVLTDNATAIVDPGLTRATVTCGGAGAVGDVDCSGDVSSIDAALTLQMVAGLVTSLPCPAGADTNGDGTINAIDVTLILQFIAGILPRLE